MSKIMEYQLLYLKKKRIETIFQSEYIKKQYYMRY